MIGPAGDRAPIVSVIIVFWNEASFIAQAMDSVLAQTYDDWELILVDDGSTDASTRVAQQYARQHPRKVRYFEHPLHENRGMSASRNLGLRHARGRYVGFLDADDAWFAQTLEEQVSTLEAWPKAAMVYGPLEWWYSWTGKPADAGRDRVEELGVPSDSLVKPPTLLALFLRDKAAVPSGMLIRREVVERVGGFEDQFRGEYEDQVFCAKVCLRELVFASSRCWYRYRQHENSAVAVGLRTGATHAARLTFLSWLAGYLRRQKVRSIAIWWAFRLELWRLTHPRLFALADRAGRMVGRLAARVPNRA